MGHNIDRCISNSKKPGDAADAHGLKMLLIFSKSPVKVFRDINFSRLSHCYRDIYVFPRDACFPHTYP